MQYDSSMYPQETESFSTKVYFRYYCNNPEIEFGPYTVNEQTAGIVTIVFDGVILLLFVYMIYNLRSCINISQEQLMQKNLPPQLFTLEIKNLPEIEEFKLKEQLLDLLNQHITKQSKLQIHRKSQQ